MKAQLPSKKKIGVLFGGPSAEHEISIVSALQAISAMDSCKFDIRPFYLHQNGTFYTSDKLLDKTFYRQFSFDLVEEVSLLPDPQIRGFSTHSKNKLYLVDVYFLCFHGQYGEDGCIQGLLEMKQAAYTGCSVIASAVAMNKHLCKLLLKEHNIPVLAHAHVTKAEALRNWREVQQKILSTPGLNRFPFFVKPCHLGSSIGLSVAEDKASLQSALAKAFYYDDEVLVEPCITKLMELNIAVCDADPPSGHLRKFLTPVQADFFPARSAKSKGNFEHVVKDERDEPEKKLPNRCKELSEMTIRASIIEMPIASARILSYEDKYMRGGSKNGASDGMASLTRVIDPEIDPEIKEAVTNYAKKAFTALGCSGVVRFDFMVDLESGALYFNELNPIPGSLAFYLWEKTAPYETFTALLNKLIDQALDRQSMRLCLQKNLEFRAL